MTVDINVFVVSNNSTAPQTAALLRELDRDTLVTVVEDDEPFNWSRLNDRIIRREVRDGIVLCLNNDMICQTPGWDQLLRAQLARREVGVVGARLLYPTGALQHAGIAMNGGWAHEGVGDYPIGGLYRELLNRAPDEGGLASYLALFGRLAPDAAFRETFTTILQSDEYRARRAVAARQPLGASS